MNKLDLHPLCKLFPPMSDAEFTSLKNDIDMNGQITPIILFDGFILDGGNRYKAVTELGKEPRTALYHGKDPVSYVLSVNLHRRHLTQGQAAVIVSTAQDWNTAHPPHRAKEVGNIAPLPKEQDEEGNIAPLLTVENRREKSGVSRKTQREADKLVKNAPPEIVQSVINGEKSLGAALVESGLTQKKEENNDEPSLNDIIDDLSELNKSLTAENTILEKAVNSDDTNAELLKQIMVLNATNSALNSRLNGMNTERTAMLGRIKWLEKHLKKYQAEIKPNNADDPW